MLLWQPRVIRCNPLRELMSFYHRRGLFLSMCGDGAANEYAVLLTDKSVFIQLFNIHAKVLPALKASSQSNYAHMSWLSLKIRPIVINSHFHYISAINITLLKSEFISQGVYLLHTLVKTQIWSYPREHPENVLQCVPPHFQTECCHIVWAVFS